MRIRVLVVTAALAFAGACATGSSVKSDTVSDETLARVPADQMGSVNQARLDVSKAKDTLNRENLRLTPGQEVRRCREQRGQDHPGAAEPG